jgi:Zn ribbon nucleic-acid-binding protein
LIHRLAAYFLLLSLPIVSQERTPTVQPIPFSHKAHVALKLKCSDCHAMPDPGEVITIPAATKCTACHVTLKVDSPAIKELRAFAQQKRAIPWARVYEIPSWVYFSHKTHLDAGAKCEACHGAVGERDRLWLETDLSMRGCMDCHRSHKATLDCAGCHEPKN